MSWLPQPRASHAHLQVVHGPNGRHRGGAGACSCVLENAVEMDVVVQVLGNEFNPDRHTMRDEAKRRSGGGVGCNGKEWSNMCERRCDALIGDEDANKGLRSVAICFVFELV